MTSPSGKSKNQPSLTGDGKKRPAPATEQRGSETSAKLDIGSFPSYGRRLKSSANRRKDLEEEAKGHSGAALSFARSTLESMSEPNNERWELNSNIYEAISKFDELEESHSRVIFSLKLSLPLPLRTELEKQNENSPIEDYHVNLDKQLYEVSSLGRRLRRQCEGFIERNLSYYSSWPLSKRIAEFKMYILNNPNGDAEMAFSTLFPEHSVVMENGESKSSDLPSSAPANWATMKQPGESPPSFIKRHYAPWLGKGLARPDIKRLDPQLYVALNNWLRNNELPTDLDLPTLKEKNDRWAAGVGEGGDLADTAREMGRLGSTLRTRLQRSREK